MISGTSEDLIVNVFVNCPYLSPSTGFVDPHYAGTFSLFGDPGHVAHDGGDRDFIIDLTEPVRALATEGRINNEELTIQLMPLPAHIVGKSETSLSVGRVDIIAV